MTEPTTAANRRYPQATRSAESKRRAFIAGWQEAEARQQDTPALREVRATLAGLSLPLGTTREAAQHERDIALALIDKALAALPPSAPPAQDARLGVLVEVAIRSTDTDLRDAARAVLPVDAWFARLEQDR